MLDNKKEIFQYQRIWENLIFPKGYCLTVKNSKVPAIFWIVQGCINLKINDIETHNVCSREMFIAHYDCLYEMTMLEQTRLLVCHVPMEIWYSEQKWIDLLISDNNQVFEGFFKLPVKKIIIQYLALLNTYLKEGIQSQFFFEIKRQELFLLLFYLYKKQDLVKFFNCFLTKDIQFKNFVINNFMNSRNVQELAKIANYSTSGFIKKFQKCFKESPYRWIQRQKANRLYYEINRGVKSLQELATDYGFSSYQHFSHFCKVQLGAPPSLIIDNSGRKVK